MISEYIYSKMGEGFNYILTPRRCGKTTAAIDYALKNDYAMCCATEWLRNKYKGMTLYTQHSVFNIIRATSKKIIFDEFEMYGFDNQVRIIDLYLKEKPDWIFISTPRNEPLSIIANSTSHPFKNIRKECNTFILDEKTLKMLKKLDNL